jgi:hypothetical protein
VTRRLAPGVAEVTQPSTAAQSARTSPLAVAALACGICEFGYLYVKALALLLFAAIVLGHIALRQIRRTGERGRGLARTALILGYGLLLAGMIPALVLLTS